VARPRSHRLARAPAAWSAEPPAVFAQEDDRVGWRAVAGWMIAAIVMVLVGIGWPWAMLAARGAPPPLHAALPPVPQRSGGVRTGLFETSPDAAHDDGAAALQRFAWADRQAGLVRIPLDDAMQLWLERNRAAGGAAPADR
jgi:hypothetical protein